MADFNKTGDVFLACPRGVPSVLVAECRDIGCKGTLEDRMGVWVRASLKDCILLNLVLRTANRVLYKVGSARVPTARELYEVASRVPWEAYINPSGFFSVTSFVQNVSIKDTRYPNLVVKDAVVDRFRKLTGRRPDAGNSKRGSVIFLFWSGNDCRLFMDTSGESLSFRGYRGAQGDAPMRETLAAAVLLAAGWKYGVPNLVNPMCGSGTLAIEAALMAKGVPAGSFRKDFGFRYIRGCDKRFEDEARKKARTLCRGWQAKIIATDINRSAIATAFENAKRAGVSDCLSLSECDFYDTAVPPPPGAVVVNPEYGERMGETEQLEKTYRRLGDFFKHKCSGYSCHIFTGNLALSRAIGLRSSGRKIFFNGPIESRLVSFEMYEGTRRKAIIRREAERAGDDFAGDEN